MAFLLDKLDNMNYKYITLTLLIFFLTLNTAHALPGLNLTQPDNTRIAAKYAKQKAKIKANNLEITQDEIDRNTDGCDLNIGNLSIDQGVNEVPNELIVIVEGDVIQANDCQTY